jgi:hypothetical protein
MRRVSVGIASVLVVLITALAVACTSGGGGNGKSSAPKAATRDHAPKTTTVVRGPDDIALPHTAENVAAALGRVERALRAPDTPPAELPRLGWEQQNAYRALRAHPDWVPVVLARLPGDLQPIVTANERARRELAALTEPQPDLPDWQILSPPPVEVLRGYYAEAEAASGIPWAFFAAIHLVETNLGRIRGASTAGAQGPMQFIPASWDQYGQRDINDNRDAILAAARLLRANGAPSDMDRALYRYNNSVWYVDAVQLHAQLMLSDERAFLGYYHWQVYYSTTNGTFLLPEGYPGTPAREVTAARR